VKSERYSNHRRTQVNFEKQEMLQQQLAEIAAEIDLLLKRRAAVEALLKTAKEALPVGRVVQHRVGWKGSNGG
jgi:hypothetical protein